jgi:hypothetical protein
VRFNAFTGHGGADVQSEQHERGDQRASSWIAEGVGLCVASENDEFADSSGQVRSGGSAAGIGGVVRLAGVLVSIGPA